MQSDPRGPRRGAVLFDLDGTLLDTAPEIAEAVNRLLNEYGAPPLQLHQVRQFIGRGVVKLIQQVLAAAELRGAASDAAAIAGFEVHYANTNCTLARPYPGVEAGLDALAADGWKLGCVTNKPQRFVGPLLAMTQLGKYFGCVVCGDSLSTMKPSPEPLLHVCRELGTDSARSVMVGDSVHDIHAAQAAGMQSYVVTYGYGDERDLATHARTHAISRLDELPALLAAQPPGK